MPTSVIYAVVVLIWGTTWFVIKFQLGVVAPEISLVYRFGLAAVCVFAYAKVTGNSLRLSWHDHRFVALQGATLFCLNYWMTYLSTQYLTSGLVASGAHLVLFTTGVGNSFVSGLAPTIKISGNPVATKRLREQLDFDASDVFDRRASLEEAAVRLQALVLEVASGTLTWGEILDEGEDVVSRLGPAL